ncbi:DUF4232 domain-containing protein [Streptomyces sp. SDr-06]|uniref:DUF4232 domain-containing protein n=1 Tax=Streptomyces sp. SDr-06 TaxID=2267702 RepID=UPI000DEB5D55|nr:DUF4232 domain-containing protein [Streptomyces sp. SDr-06]RCH64761.1 DUF4232 domain-containing protein [Streptomyces sp. SDr-06]
MRTSFRIAAAATTTLIAALALTACGSDSGSDAALSSDQPSASAPATAAPAPTAGDAAGSKGSDSGKGVGTGSGKHTGAPAKSTGKSTKKPSGGGGDADAPCTGADVKLTATPVKRPVNHILLTVTNTSRTMCSAYNAPAVSFSSSQQAPIPVDKETIPQAVVSLAPGASAYAMVRTLGEDDGSASYRTSKVTVYFQGKVGMESTGPAAHASLPQSVAVVDSQAMATYWQSDLSAIDSW